jgi:hypothetical protein
MGKSKPTRPGTKSRKKSVRRAASSKSKRTAKKRPSKTTRKRASNRTQLRQTSKRAGPIVQDTVVDIIDEPLPGVVRVTEIEEVSVDQDEE